MAAAPIRRHYAVALSKTKGGWRVDYVADYRSRGEADIASLRLAARHADTAALTLVDRELAEGDVLTAADLGR